MLKKVNSIAEYNPEGHIQLPEEIIHRMVKMGLLDEVENKHEQS